MWLKKASQVSSKLLTVVDHQVKAAFSDAIRLDELVEKVTGSLHDHGGFQRETTLLATSLCSDEVNRDMEQAFARQYGGVGTYFSMGGLAGFPFGGVAALNAMAHHVPEERRGSCLIVFGPHVGIDRDGNVGSVNRRGQHEDASACCGSANAVYANMKRMSHAHRAIQPIDPSQTINNLIDVEQSLVGELLRPYADLLLQSPQPMVQLPLCCYQVQKRMMNQILAAASPEIRTRVGKIALLGGILINTSPEVPDFFLPCDFELRNNQNQLVQDLLWIKKNNTKKQIIHDKRSDVLYVSAQG